MVPFVFELHGGLGKRAEEFIDLIAQYGNVMRLMEFNSRISKVI